MCVLMLLHELAFHCDISECTRSVCFLRLGKWGTLSGKAGTPGYRRSASTKGASI